MHTNTPDPTIDDSVNAKRVYDIARPSMDALHQEDYGASVSAAPVIAVGEYSFVTIQMVSTAASLTVEASSENNGTEGGSATPIDITQYGCTPLHTGTAAASYSGNAVLRVDVRGYKFLYPILTADANASSLFVNGEY